jgi:hypothetical protein
MKIITAVVNNPAFIEIQYHTLKKFLICEEGYEFIIFNDAKTFPDVSNDGDLTISSKIEETCHKLGIKSITLPNQHHINIPSMSARHADTFNNHLLKYQKQYPDKYLLLDSDMFLIDYLNINKYTAYESAIVLQQRPNLNYIWPGLCYLDFTKMQNVDLLDWSLSRGGDSGANMCHWLAKQTENSVVPKCNDLRWAAKDNTFHIENAVYFIRHLWSCSWNENELPENLKTNTDLLQFLKEDVRNVNGKFYCEIYDNVFLHYRAGSNWNKEGMVLHNMLTEKLQRILL